MLTRIGELLALVELIQPLLLRVPRLRVNDELLLLEHENR